MNKGLTNADWSDHAKKYQEASENLTAFWERDALQVTQDKVKQLLNQHQDRALEFLDVGCGPGGLSFGFAEKHASESTNIHITATDLADGMLELVNNRLKEDSSLASIISTVQMDGRDLDKVADASVDVVGSNFGLSIFPQRERGWESAHRVLKSGGVLFATAWDAESANMTWVDRLTQRFNAAAPDAESTPMPMPSQTIGTDAERISKELEAAGFKNVEAFQTTHTVVQDADTLIQIMLDNPGFARFLERLTREEFVEEMASLLRMSTSRRTHRKSGIAGKLGVAMFDMTGFVFVAKK